jgi:hypothetical protein
MSIVSPKPPRVRKPLPIYLRIGPYSVVQDPPYQWIIQGLRKAKKGVETWKPIFYAANLEYCCYHLINLLMLAEPTGTHEDALKSFREIQSRLEKLRLDAVETIRREARLK